MKKVKACLCAVLLCAVLFASCSDGNSGGSSGSDDDNSFPEQLLSYVGDKSYKSPNNASVEDAKHC